MRTPRTTLQGARARFAGPAGADLQSDLARHLQEHVTGLETARARLSARSPLGSLDLRFTPGGFSVKVAASGAAALLELRETVHHALRLAMPQSEPRLDWQGCVPRDGAPPNFHLARVRSVDRVSPRFLRVTLDCEGAAALAAGPGLQVSLLLPRGPAPA